MTFFSYYIQQYNKDIMVSPWSPVFLSICILFLDDNLSKYIWIFTKLGMCIDIKETSFWIAYGHFFFKF